MVENMKTLAVIRKEVAVQGQVLERSRDKIRQLLAESREHLDGDPDAALREGGASLAFVIAGCLEVSADALEFVMRSLGMAANATDE